MSASVGSESPNDAMRQATHSLDRMVKYPFPLRKEICCFLEVPRDLTKQEVNRITNYLLSLST